MTDVLRLKSTAPLILGFAALLAACGGNAAGTTTPSPSSTAGAVATSSSVASVPASASSAAKPSSGSSASGAAKPSAAAAAEGAGTVALAWYDGINRGDAEATAAAFTENAVLITNGACAPPTPCMGRDVILQRVRAVIMNHAKPTPVGAPIVAGNLVEIRQETRGDNQTAAGVERIALLGVETVQGDKISSRIEFPDLTDAQTAKFQSPNASAAASPKPDTDALQRWTDAIGRGDTAGASAQFVDKGVYVGGPPCANPTPCIGQASLTTRFQNAVSQHTKLTLVGSPTVVGNLVQLRWEIRNDAVSAAGVERQISLGFATLQGDKIAALLTAPDVSDEQTMKFQLAAPPAATKPAASAPASPGSER